MSQHKDLEARIRDLEAIHEIMNLEADYAYANDTQDPDLYASVFTEDGVVEMGGLGLRITGRDNLKEYCRAFPLGFAFSMHCMHNPHIAVNGDTAKGRFYWEASLTWAPTNEAVITGGFSHDEFVKTDQGWKIKEKITTLHYFTRYDKGWVEEPMMEVGDLASLIPSLHDDSADKG